MGFDWFDIMRPCRIIIWRVPSWHPWAFFKNWWFIWYSEALFHLNVKNQNACIFANIAGIICIRVSSPRFPDMGNTMDTLFWWSNMDHAPTPTSYCYNKLVNDNCEKNLNNFFISTCVLYYTFYASKQTHMPLYIHVHMHCKPVTLFKNFIFIRVPNLTFCSPSKLCSLWSVLPPLACNANINAGEVHERRACHPSYPGIWNSLWSDMMIKIAFMR